MKSKDSFLFQVASRASEEFGWACVEKDIPLVL